MAYYLLFLITGIVALFYKNKNVIPIILVIILSVFAGSRYYIDNDYEMYYDIFYYVEDKMSDFSQRLISLEWTMYFIPNFFRWLFESKQEVVFASFMLYAFLGVWLKIAAIRKYSDFFLLAVLLYVSNLFFIMEMTTIRAGVAAAIFLISIKYLARNQNFKFFLALLCCLLFHSSSVVFFVVWLFIKFKISIKYYLGVLALSILVMIFKINLLTLLFLDRIFPRIKFYLEAKEWQNEVEVNIFSFKALFAIAISVVFTLYYRRLKNKPYFDILFKAHLLSLCMFFALSNTAQVFSLRTFEMLSVVQILLYPMLIYVFKPQLKIIGWAIILIFAIIQLIYLVEISEIYKTYQSWL